MAASPTGCRKGRQWTSFLAPPIGSTSTWGPVFEDANRRPLLSALLGGAIPAAALLPAGPIGPAGWCRPIGRHGEWCRAIARHGVWCRLLAARFLAARSMVPPNGAARSMVPAIAGTVSCRALPSGAVIRAVFPGGQCRICRGRMQHLLPGMSYFLAASVAPVSLRQGFGKGGAVPRREARSRAFFWRHAPPADWPAGTVPPRHGAANRRRGSTRPEQSADWLTVLAGRQTGADRNWGLPGRECGYPGTRMSGNADVRECGCPGMRSLGMRSLGMRSLGMRSLGMRSLGMRMSWSMRSPGTARRPDWAGGNGAGQLPGTEYGAAYWRHGVPPPEMVPPIGGTVPAAAGRAAGRLAGGKKRGGRVWQDAKASRCAAVLRDGRCRPAGMVPPGYGAAYWRRGSWRHGVAGRMRVGLYGACNWRRGFGPARFPGDCAVPGTVRARERGHVKKQSVGLDDPGGRSGALLGAASGERGLEERGRGNGVGVRGIAWLAPGKRWMQGQACLVAVSGKRCLGNGVGVRGIAWLAPGKRWMQGQACLAAVSGKRCLGNGVGVRGMGKESRSRGRVS